MFSLKEHTDSTIIALLFLVAINFLHIGQLFLPIVCLYIFIDNKGKLVVNNWFTFILLCLFGISFFAFSYKLGFYSTMGLCLPMAYYIGSNIKKTDEESLKKVIYLFAFGMAIHIVLNLITDIVIDGKDFIGSISHYDIWIKEGVLTTSTAVNSIFVIALLYYFIVHETNRKYKVIGISLFALIMLYDIALGRRTPLFMTALCIFISILIDQLLFKSNKNIKPLIFTAIVLFVIALLFFLTYSFNLFGLKETLMGFGIVKKFMEYGLDSGRLKIFFKAIKLVPQHLWGAQEIRNILDIQIHDLWMDTFDYAGIIPFVLLVIHSLMFIKTIKDIIKSKKINNSFKLFVLVLFIAIAIQLFLEPIMSGSSLFIIIVIIIEAILEKIVIYEDR